MLTQSSVEKFLDDLASLDPTPGGGAAAAIMGAMGAALVSMVCNVTIGKKGYESVEPEMRAVLHETGVSVCSRVHFGRSAAGEREQYVRLAYSGIDTARIVEGLERLRAYLSTDGAEAGAHA